MKNQQATPPEQTEHRRITLIEVVVVVVVLFIVGSVLLTALTEVQREAHKLVMCKNHLKQLGLAVHNYQVTRKGRLPSGTIIESAKEPEDRLSFLVLLLPYLEQDALFQNIDKTKGWEAATNQSWVETPVSLFRCPADQRSTGDYANITNYVGVSGVGNDSTRLKEPNNRTGAFGYDRVGHNGTSNTLLFIETAKDNGPWAAGGPATIRFVDPDDPTPIARDGAFGLVHPPARRFWQRIAVSANVAMADGSVRTIDEKVSPKILAALATASGGEVIGDW